MCIRDRIPEDAAGAARQLALTCDAMLIVGTSASVYPCAGLPFLAKEHGAVIVECNLEPTEFTQRITDVFLQGPSGMVLPRLYEACKTLKV